MASLGGIRAGDSGPAQVDVTLTALFAGWRHIDRIEEARDPPIMRRIGCFIWTFTAYPMAAPPRGGAGLAR